MSDLSRTSSDVFLLPLADDGAPDVPGGYIYLPPPSDPPYVVRFCIEGTSSICRQGSLWTNLPAVGQKFVRDRFREFKLHPDFSRNIEISIPITTAGAFAFYVSFTPLPDYSLGAIRVPQSKQTALHYLDICPRLSLQNKLLPLNALSIFSVVSKFMGKYPEHWENHLEGIGRLSYNMVHFTPLMRRGESDSPYSICDQLTFDPQCFPKGEKDVADIVKRMEQRHGLLSLTDIVWNHTANNSSWLEEHPEAGYNMETAPWLQPALELETALLKYSENLINLGLPTQLETASDLRRLTDSIRPEVIDKIRLWEFYVINVKRDASHVIDIWSKSSQENTDAESVEGKFQGLGDAREWSIGRKAGFLHDNALVGTDQLGERFRRRVNPSVGAKLISAIFENSADNDNKDVALNEITMILNELNLPLYKEYDDDSAEISKQVFDRANYLRLDVNGPKIGPITKGSPLIETYFTRLPLNARTQKHNPGCLYLANNGWVWNADAMRDNAGPSSKAYVRRELIVWSDCVKLRYESCPKENPWLWDFMAKYTRLMAKHFVGFRIDNCHSTPIAVAEYLLDHARQVRPNLYVCGELFTGSEEMDYVFVQRLGISSLIREAMQARDTGELSRQVHLQGGKPIGSFDLVSTAGLDTFAPIERVAAKDSTSYKKETYHRINQTSVHALFMDCTHDNQVPAQKREARDTLPNAALVYMCACATGSVMGYDDIYPKLVDIVHGTRAYMITSTQKQKSQTGIRKIKKLLNDIHALMGIDGYDETYIHHEGEYITVHRVHPRSRKGYFLIAHTAFPGNMAGNGVLSPVHLSGTKVELMGSWTLEVDESEEAKSAALSDTKVLKGLPSRIIDNESISIDEGSGETVISVCGKFSPGSIALFKTWIPGAERTLDLDKFITTEAVEAFNAVNLIDLNFVLYRCEPEERDSSKDRDGVYVVPNHGPLVYAGLQGWWSILKDIVKTNNLGHPLCQHLRDGQWALDYIVGRMERVSNEWADDRLQAPTQWLRKRLNSIRSVPNFLLPRYFAMVVQTAYNAAFHRGIILMSAEVKNGQRFLQSLAMVSVQQTGLMRSASLYPTKNVPSMAAGLPHFARDWTRCWGRDIFLSLRGLLLSTGRYGDAREHILAFASVLKHGMIPNLLNSGEAPRYNSRDSVWFFLQSIQDYTKMVPGGAELLQEKVLRRFLPYDDTWFPYDDPLAYSKATTIEEVIQEVVQRHATGLCFREEKAGPELDMQMKPEGFQVEARVHFGTGLILGGNQSNCGTWQDKMGESEKAGNRGVPGTPRDGAAIEITGLCYSTVAWLNDLVKHGKYKYEGVNSGPEDQVLVTFQDWKSLIERKFERCYYIPPNAKDDSSYDINPKMVNRRGIYKDLYKSGKEYEDYQLRPNFAVAMCVAPELFEPKKALYALHIADIALRGPLGMATLDPSDRNYRPYYHNSEDSTDFATAKGRNYHQGPEWVWPTGYFLRAFLHFDLLRRETKEEKIETLQQITRRLKGCKQALERNPWAGLPELTNKNGEFCTDSSPTQAWSAGCILDVFHDASKLSLG